MYGFGFSGESSNAAACSFRGQRITEILEKKIYMGQMIRQGLNALRSFTAASPQTRVAQEDGWKTEQKRAAQQKVAGPKQ